MSISRFRDFVQSFTRLVDEFGDNERIIFTDGKDLFLDLILHDDWLPDVFAKFHTDNYQQYLLHCDPMERFSVVSFVWGPGQKTPIHDHTVWGMVGVLRGSEICDEYFHDTDTGQFLVGRTHNLLTGEVDLVSPRIGDIHKVSNALNDQSSVSIHIYGGNIGVVNRHIYELPNGYQNPFVSGYSNAVIPNIWDKPIKLTE